MTTHPPLLRGGARALAAALVLAAAAAPAVEVGEPAPDFTLDAYGGGTVTMSDHAGQVVFLCIIGFG